MFTVFKKIFLASMLVVLTTNAWQSIRPVLAQSQNPAMPDTPLYQGLTWRGAGPFTRDIRINLLGDSISLSGEKYEAVEKFTSQLPQDVLYYYSNAQLAKAGWASYDAIQALGGTRYVFYHEAGVYLSIEFLECLDAPSYTCVTVWKSGQTKPLINTPARTTEPSIAAITGSFGKRTPANGATNLNPASITLSWDAYSPTPDKYSYCLKVGSACDASDPNWTSVYSTSITLTNLAYDTIYYWQVKAITCVTCIPKTYVYADGGTWWTFKTKPNQVTILGNAGVSGAVLSYIDSTLKSVTADGSGNYTIIVPYGWSGTVTPAKPGYLFTPPSATFTNLTASQTIQNFTATVAYSISGNVGAPNVTLSYTQGGVQTVTSDSNGNYSILVPPGWSGTITPSRPGFTFTPANRSYPNVTANQIGQNYSAFISLSGNVGTAGATLSYVDGTPQTVTSTGSGDYLITVPYGWSGTVTPSLSGDAFCPTSKTYTNLTSSQSMQHYAHSACAQFDPMSQWTTDYSYNAQGWRVQFHPRLTGDVDGDGDDDIVGFGYDRVLVALSNGNDGFAPMTEWTTDYSYNAQQWRTEYHPRLLGDVDGDGDDDIVGFGYDRVLVALSNGVDGFAPMIQWTTDYSYNAQQWRTEYHPRVLGDVDGDGDDDIIGFGYDRVLVALSNGVNGFAPMTQWTTDYSYNAQGWRVPLHPRLVGDVNGDGRADIVGFGYDRVLVALSTGTSFAPMMPWTTDYSYNAQGWRVEFHPRILGDVNGDGKADIIGFGYDRVLVALSNGSGFATMVQATTDFNYNAQQWRVEYHPRLTGDFNGDGLDDLIGFGYDRVLVATAK